MAEPVVDTWESMIRFYRTATTAMNETLQARFGHSLDDYDLLHQIHIHDGPIRMGSLAERLLIANSSCNRAVGRLVTAGLIHRTHGDDRREVWVSLTPLGARLRREMAVAHVRDIRRMLGEPLTSTNQQELHEMFETLNNSME